MVSKKQRKATPELKPLRQVRENQNFIKEWREYRGFHSQSALGLACGLPSQTINRLESHQLWATHKTLVMLSSVLGCSEGDLISRDPGVGDDGVIIAACKGLTPKQRKLVLRFIAMVAKEEA